MCRRQRAQRRARHLLGAGLADRPGDGEDARATARARGDAEPLQPAQRVVHDELRVGDVLGARDQRGAGAGGERAGDMVVTVMRIALDGDEQIAWLQGAGVD